MAVSDPMCPFMVGYGQFEGFVSSCAFWVMAQRRRSKPSPGVVKRSPHTPPCPYPIPVNNPVNNVFEEKLLAIYRILLTVGQSRGVVASTDKPCFLDQPAFRRDSRWHPEAVGPRLGNLPVENVTYFVPHADSHEEALRVSETLLSAWLGVDPLARMGCLVCLEPVPWQKGRFE